MLRHCCFTAITAGALISSARADVLFLVADRDASLIQSASTSQRSNGTGDGLYTGRINRSTNSIRRAAVHFDLAGSLPAGAVITNAALFMFQEQAAPGSAPGPVTLHSLTANWSEGPTFSAGGQGDTAVDGDLTWFCATFPATPWANPGGDFDPTPLASVVADTNPGQFIWSSPAMNAQAQAWLDNPASNFGWMLRGDESALGTAREWMSREAVAESERPTLFIEYTVIPTPAGAAPLTLTTLLLLQRRRR